MAYLDDSQEQYTVAAGGIISQFGPETFDSWARFVTAGMFGATIAFVPNDFIWNPPTTPQRQNTTRMCPITGYKGPASEFVSCDGLLVLKDFAVTKVNK